MSDIYPIAVPKWGIEMVEGTINTWNKAEGDAGNSPFTFTATRSGNLSATTTVDFAVTGSGADPADAADPVAS